MHIFIVATLGCVAILGVDGCQPKPAAGGGLSSGAHSAAQGVGSKLATSADSDSADEKAREQWIQVQVSTVSRGVFEDKKVNRGLDAQGKDIPSDGLVMFTASEFKLLIYLGMSRQQVMEYLGKPGSVSNNGSGLEYVYFMDKAPAPFAVYEDASMIPYGDAHIDFDVDGNVSGVRLF